MGSCDVDLYQCVLPNLAGNDLRSFVCMIYRRYNVFYISNFTVISLKRPPTITRNIPLLLPGASTAKDVKA